MIIFSILTIVAALILILVVLVQNSKGGGLASNFSSSNQIMGAPKTADFLEKATWTLAGFIIVCSLVSAKLVGTGSDSTPKPVNMEMEQNDVPDLTSPLPVFPEENNMPQLPDAE